MKYKFFLNENVRVIYINTRFYKKIFSYTINKYDNESTNLSL